MCRASLRTPNRIAWRELALVVHADDGDESFGEPTARRDAILKSDEGGRATGESGSFMMKLVLGRRSLLEYCFLENVVCLFSSACYVLEVIGG